LPSAELCEKESEREILKKLQKYPDQQPVLEMKGNFGCSERWGYFKIKLSFIEEN
jgi:hypothetical protein